MFIWSGQIQRCIVYCIVLYLFVSYVSCPVMKCLATAPQPNCPTGTINLSTTQGIRPKILYLTLRDANFGNHIQSEFGDKCSITNDSATQS